MKMFSFSKLSVKLLSIITFAFALIEEPNCVSRFDYEYKVIQKLTELENQVNDQQKTINTLTEQATATMKFHQEVAFSAYLLKDLTKVLNCQIIIFDEVQTNIGESYNGKTGIFVCKIPGVYVFHWVTTVKDRTYMDTHLVINGAEKCRAFSDAGNHDDYAVSTNTVISELKFGDQVWIRCGDWHNRHIAGAKRTSFSGWLLYSR